MHSSLVSVSTSCCKDVGAMRLIRFDEGEFLPVDNFFGPGGLFFAVRELMK
jgi:hypothetical protein